MLLGSIGRRRLSIDFARVKFASGSLPAVAIAAGEPMDGTNFTGSKDVEDTGATCENPAV